MDSSEMGKVGAKNRWGHIGPRERSRLMTRAINVRWARVRKRRRAARQAARTRALHRAQAAIAS